MGEGSGESAYKHQQIHHTNHPRSCLSLTGSIVLKSSVMFGLLNIDKPQGVTSRDVVNRVQRVLRGEKVGHAGTLDPLATGVLVVCVGPATRLVEYVQRMRKQYSATFLLGKTSDTEDIEGNVVDLAEPPCPSRADIEAALPKFVGDIQQRPPAYSALKVGGRRAYELARKGKQVELLPRKITVHEMTVSGYEYPELKLQITCGSGTYVRSLGRDLAESLDTGAVMSALERTAIGSFRIDDAVDPDGLSAKNVSDFLLSPRDAVSELPSVELTQSERHRIGNGLSIDNRWQLQCPEIAALDESGRLAALLTQRGPELLRPVRNFPPADTD